MNHCERDARKRHPTARGGGVRNPEYDPDMVSCPECGEDRWAVDAPCPHCGAEWGDTT